MFRDVPQHCNPSTPRCVLPFYTTRAISNEEYKSEVEFHVLDRRSVWWHNTADAARFVGVTTEELSRWREPRLYAACFIKRRFGQQRQYFGFPNDGNGPALWLDRLKLPDDQDDFISSVVQFWPKGPIGKFVRVEALTPEATTNSISGLADACINYYGSMELSILAPKTGRQACILLTALVTSGKVALPLESLEDMPHADVVFPTAATSPQPRNEETGEYSFSDTTTGIAALGNANGLTGADAASASPSDDDEYWKSSFSMGNIVHRHVDEKANVKSILTSAKVDGADILLVPPNGPAQLMGVMRSRNTHLTRRSIGGRKRSSGDLNGDSFDDARLAQRLLSDTLTGIVGCFGRQEVLQGFRQYFKNELRSAPNTQQDFDACAEATSDAFSAHFHQNLMDKFKGSNLSQVDLHLITSIFTKETVEEASIRGPADANRSQYHSKVMLANYSEVDELVKKYAVEFAGLTAGPMTEKELRVCDNKGVWQAASLLFCAKHPGEMKFNTSTSSRMKDLYKVKNDLPRRVPKPTPLVKKVQVNFLTSEGSRSVLCQLPSMPTQAEYQKDFLSKVVGEPCKPTTGAACEIITIDLLKGRQQISESLRKEKEDGALDIALKRQSERFEQSGGARAHIYEPNWADVINQNTSAAGGEEESIRDRHGGIETGVLANLLERLHEDDVELNLTDLLGPEPTLSEARDIANKEMFYVGTMRRFNVNGEASWMRVLYLRIVLCIILQRLAVIGAFNDDLADGCNVEIDYRIWIDGTTIARKKTEAVYAFLIFSALVFKASLRFRVEDARPVVLSLDCADNRSANDLLFALVGLQIAVTMIIAVQVPYRDKPGYKTINCHVRCDGLNSDSHPAEVLHGRAMSGNNTCAYCDSPRPAWGKAAEVLKANAITLESQRQVHQANTKASITPDFAIAVLMGDFDASLKERNMDALKPHIDAPLHHNSAIAKFHGFWAWYNALSAKEQALVNINFDFDFDR